MLEIFILIYLTGKIGRLATQKGLRKNLWKFFMVASWIVMEILGAILGAMIFGADNFISILLVAIAFAFTSYVLLKSILNKKPDIDLDDAIYKIGQEN